MYILSIIGLVLVVLFVECSMWGIENSLAVLVDPPSLTLLLIIGAAMLLAAGLGKDFLAAFRLAFGRERQAGLRERKRAAEAVELFMKAMRYGSIFTVLLQFIAMHNLMKDTAQWSIYLSVLFLAMLYAYIINLLLLPVKSRLNLGIIEYMQGPGAEEGMKETGSRTGEKGMEKAECRTEEEGLEETEYGTGEESLEEAEYRTEEEDLEETECRTGEEGVEEAECETEESREGVQGSGK